MRVPILSALALASACTTAPTRTHTLAEPPLPDPVHGAIERQIERQIDRQIDRDVDPCLDFAAFACGGWARANPVPHGRATWSVLDEMSGADLALLRELVEDGVDEDATRFHRACLEPSRRHEALAPLMTAIDAVDDAPGFLRAVGVLARHDIPSLFSSELRTDWNAPERLAFVLLPPSPRLAAEASPTELAATIERQLASVGETTPAAALAIAVFERERARAARSSDAAAVHGTDLHGDLAAWPALVDGLGGAAAVTSDAIAIYDRGYVLALDDLVRRTRPAVLRAWLRWRVADALARDLGEEPAGLARRLGELAGGETDGDDRVDDRDDWCVWQTAERFPAALGRAFAARTVGADGIARARAIVSDVRRAVDAVAPRFADLALAEASARRLAGVTVRVGHAEHVEPGPPLGDDHLANVLALARDRTASALAQAGSPLVHDRWDHLQFLPTAFHDPLAREVSLGIGILQPPVLRAGAPLALEYGALGGIAAHELSHVLVSGFTYDGAIGWDDPFDRALAPAAACLAESTSPPVVVDLVADEVHVDDDTQPSFVAGDYDVIEAVADLGGVRFAYAAYRERRGDARPLPVAGLSDEQLFFVGYAGFFCGAHAQTATLDERRPLAGAAWRLAVLGQHLPELREAFACDPPPEDDACMPW